MKNYFKGLSLRDCLGIDKPDRLYHANLNIAQIIQMGQQYGQTLTNQQAQDIMDNNQGGDPQAVDTYFQNQQAQQQQVTNYNAAQGSAVNTLQGQQGSIASAYNSLLQDTLGVGTAAYNTATQATESLLANRGILGPAAGTALSAAQTNAMAPTYAAIGQIGVGSAAAQSTLAQNIAGIQSGAGGSVMNYNLALGSLAENLAYGSIQAAGQVAAAQAKTPFTVAANQLVFSPSTGLYSAPTPSQESALQTGGGGNGIPTVGANSNMIIRMALGLLENKSNNRKPQSTIGKYVT